jgi:hypothetical protein
MKLTPRSLLLVLRRHERGQAAFEFLLMLPLLVGILLFVVDIGMAMYEYVSISNAVREGARYAAVNCGTAGACTVPAVQGRAAARAGGLTIPTSEITATWSGHNRGDSVAVSINHPYAFLFFPGVSMNVSACSEMRLEQQDGTASLSGGGAC